MSDYFSNLTARTLNRTEVIQPRLASRFEPVHTEGALGLVPTPPAWPLAAELAFDDEQAALPATASPAPQSVGDAQSAYHKMSVGQSTRTTAAVAVVPLPLLWTTMRRLAERSRLIRIDRGHQARWKRCDHRFALRRMTLCSQCKRRL